MSQEPSARDQLAAGTAILAASSSAPRRDAELLLRHALRKDRAWLLAHPEIVLTETQAAEYNALLARRAQHEPIQYIFGEQEFFGLRFRVTPAVLIPPPRQSTWSKPYSRGCRTTAQCASPMWARAQARLRSRSHLLSRMHK
jgi:methylase of polypeptide subunit release factors